MKVFVVYDETGRIYSAEYAEKSVLPDEIKFLYVDMDENSYVKRVDVSDPKNHKLICSEPRKVIEVELAELRESNERLTAYVEYLSMMSRVEVEEVE
jgi:hypothetical protein